MTSRYVLLSGTVGSTAYNLAHQDSDIDTLGVYAAPAEDFFGLHPVSDSDVTHEPDVTLHELAKFLKLVMKGNPAVTELLWLPEHLYQICTPLGRQLIDLRTQLSAAPKIRQAYLGFADGQVQRIKRRLAGDFDRAELAKIAKHARHVMRLLMQGFQLYSTGRLDVALDEKAAAECRDFGERVAAGLADLDELLTTFRHRFDWCVTALPGAVDEPRIEAWLRGVRRDMLLHPPTSTKELV